MDKMQPYEAAEFFRYLSYVDMNGWEQTRLLISCWVDHKNVEKLSDIIKFPWDKDVNKDDYNEQEVTQKEAKELEKLSSMIFEKYIKKE